MSQTVHNIIKSNQKPKIKKHKSNRKPQIFIFIIYNFNITT